MKNIIRTLAVIVAMTWATISQAGILDGKFGTGQMFDVQYYWSGNDLVASGFTRVFSSSGQLTTQFYTDMQTNGRYFAFFNSTTHPGQYGLGVYNSDGTLYQELHPNGTITAIGTDAIFYLGSEFYGTVIPTTQGYAFGDSATFTGMNTSPTQNDLNNYAAGTTPLVAGQSANNNPTPVYLSSITSTQTAQKTVAYATTTGNNIDLTITGNSNAVDIQQISDGNYLLMAITGNTNTVDVIQSGTNITRNFADININGSTNTMTFTQQDASEKVAFVDVDGSFGDFTILQQGTGTHYLDLTSVGNDAIVDITQEGTGNHSATIELTNGGGNWDFTLIQSGSTNQLYSLPHNLSDNSVVSGTCNSGTCVVNIVQQ